MVYRKLYLILLQNPTMKIMDYYMSVLETAVLLKRVILLSHTAKKGFGEQLSELILQAEAVPMASTEFQVIIHLCRSRITKRLRKSMLLDLEILTVLHGADRVKCLSLILGMVILNHLILLCRGMI